MLPLAEEIRDLRARATRADAASRALAEVHSAKLTTEIVATQARGRPGLEVALPAVPLLESVAERFGLPAPRIPEGSFAERIEAVLTALRATIDALRPIAAEARALGETLHARQHEQSDLLEDPQYAVLVARLRELAQERDLLGSRLGPIQQAHGLAAVVLPKVDEFAARLGEHVERARNDPRARVALARTAAEVARIYVDTTASLCARVDLRVVAPVMADASGLDRDGLIAVTDAVRADLLRFRDDLAPALGAMQAEVSALEGRWNELTAQMVELTG